MAFKEDDPGPFWLADKEKVVQNMILILDLFSKSNIQIVNW